MKITTHSVSTRREVHAISIDRSTRRSYSKALKAKIIAESNRPGVVIADLAVQYVMPAKTIYQWRACERQGISSRHMIQRQKVMLPVEQVISPKPFFLPAVLPPARPRFSWIRSRFAMLLGAV